MDNRTEQLADGVWRVEVGPVVNAYLVADDGTGQDGGLTIVDTGFASGGPRMVRSIRMLGFDARNVRRVACTHWHLDHTGAAARWATSSAAPDVLVGAGDHDVLAGRVPRPAPASRVGKLAQRLVSRPDVVASAAPLADGDELDVCGGMRVVATPGHTLGHVALWLPTRGVVLAGDAVWNIWRPTRGPRAVCEAPDARPASVRRLIDLGADTVAIGHGRPIIGARLRHLARLAT